jgi:Lrp/AsnC family transcriptional regulator, leucine-responsive regulatory protein
MEKIEKIDGKDIVILKILQENGRESLTNIAKQIDVSVDTANARIRKLAKSGVIDRTGIFIDPGALGFPIVADVKIRLHNVNDENFPRFMNYLVSHPNVIELITVHGDFDITCVLIARDTGELESISLAIRKKFGPLIAEWKGAINLKIYKFEHYDVAKLLKD